MIQVTQTSQLFSNQRTNYLVLFCSVQWKLQPFNNNMSFVKRIPRNRRKITQAILFRVNIIIPVTNLWSVRLWVQMLFTLIRLTWQSDKRFTYKQHCSKQRQIFLINSSFSC